MKQLVHDVVHTAIATHDKELAKWFYAEVLGGEVAREYDDRVTFKLFEHQLVCHLEESAKPKEDATNPLSSAYPRHFGMTFLNESDVLETHARLLSANCQYLQSIRTRFADLPERHKTFFVADPTHNIVEFKWYEDPKYVY